MTSMDAHIICMENSVRVESSLYVFLCRIGDDVETRLANQTKEEDEYY